MRNFYKKNLIKDSFDYDQKQTVDILGIRNEGRGFGESDTHWAYTMQIRRGKRRLIDLTSLCK